MYYIKYIKFNVFLDFFVYIRLVSLYFSIKIYFSNKLTLHLRNNSFSNNWSPSRLLLGAKIPPHTLKTRSTGNVAGKLKINLA